METSIRKIPAVFLLAILCLTIFPISAFAAGGVDIKLPVSMELSGETPFPEETYTIVLQALDNEPMPSENTLKITGGRTAAFPAITYSAPGLYCYTVTQQAGSHAQGHYDETVYYVKVTVTNAGSGGLKATIAAHTDNEMTSKKDDIKFTNTYDAAPKPPGPARPDSPSQTKPTGTSPKTGDTTNLPFWISLCVVSGCGLVALFLVSHKRRNGNEANQA